ncbi:MAG: hypothetical protein ACFCVC_18995 [Acidimicrobiia bacterium]
MKVSLVVLMIVLAACTSAPGVVASVEGVDLSAEELSALNAAGPSTEIEERASSLYLLVLHRLLTAGAQAEFEYAVPEAELTEAFDNRTRGLGEDIDAVLDERGVTRDRIMLEAELDVIRGELEGRLVRTEGHGFDFDEAFRGFLSVNSRACMVVLNLADAGLVPDIQARVDAGEDLDAIFEAYPDRTARLDMGCASPIDHGPALAPVALDGEVGVSYARPAGDGAIFVAKVTERDAPTADAVREEVLIYGVESQGPQLFNAWAADILMAAEVDVADEIGTWGPGPDTGDVPTIVPAG